jgi:hypothetical protein
LSDFQLVSDNNNSVPATASYVHATNNGISATYDWNPVNTFRQQKDGITVFVCSDESNSSVNALNSSTSPLHMSGFTVSNADGGTYGRVNPAITDTKIYHYLVDMGPKPISGTISDFSGDGVHTFAYIPSTAVPVICLLSGANNSALTDPTRIYVAVDPVKQLVYIGEGQLFNSNGDLSNNRGTFLDNLICYVANAARYGSHFTDLLRDDLSIPAPWDNYWGPNKGVPAQ